MSTATLINKDCILAMNELELQSVDLIVTDPPYNLGVFMKDRATNLHKMRDNFFGAAGWDDMGLDDWVSSMDTFFETSLIRYL